MKNQSLFSPPLLMPPFQPFLTKFQKIVGEKNVLSKEVELLLYSYDAALDRALPCCVVFPETTEQVSSCVKICKENKIPYVARGAGTNLCGGTIPLKNACVIALTRMNKILKIDPEKRIAVVEPGVPNLFLKRALQPYGLFYAPDPASQKSCTIGGNIGSNAGGPHCLKYGVTSHHILGLTVVLPDGEIIETELRNSGPDWTGFFVGSEGTLGIITCATLNLIPIPKFIETMLASFPSLESAIQTVTEIIASGIIPATLEAMDKLTVQAVEEYIHAGYPLEAEAVLLIEVDGDEPLKLEVEKVRELCKKNGALEFRIAKNEMEREKLWEGRRGSYPAMARLAPNVLVEDGAVPRNKLPQALKEIRKIAEEYGLSLSLVFHAGDGNLHPQILFDERNQAQTCKVKEAGTKMLQSCVQLGGTISGEHGIGMDKREAMRWLFSPETLELFRRIKESLDPENLCNPDKLIPTNKPINSEKIKKENSTVPQERGSYLVATGSSGYFEPKTEEELCSLIREFSQKKEKCFICGIQSRCKLLQGEAKVITAKVLNKIIEHDLENFTVTVEAGIQIDQLQKELKRKNQKVLLPEGGTVGGCIATNPLALPPIRDQILGMRVVLSDGSVVQFGAKVMKNVAGYDAMKLFLGSCGTLGVIVSVILKTFPESYKPPATFYSPLFMAERKVLSKNWSELHKKIKRAFDPKELFPSLDVLLSSF